MDEKKMEMVTVPTPDGDVAVPNGEGGWSALTREQVGLLPDRTPVRVEWDATAIEGLLHRESTDDMSLCLRYGDGRYQWTGRLALVYAVYVHPEDVPDPEYDRIERVASAMFYIRVGRGAESWDDTSDRTKRLYRNDARDIIALALEEQA